MSYDLYIWDAARHSPLPTDASDALDIMERLSEKSDAWNSTLAEFGIALVERYQSLPLATKDRAGTHGFWGSDPRQGTTKCKMAAYRLALPTDECTQQIAFVVEAAARLGLVVFDDNFGTCFLPDGTIFPEDMRPIWESDLADLRAKLADPNWKKPDGRNFWQKLAGGLVDALGR